MKIIHVSGVYKLLDLKQIEYINVNEETMTKSILIYEDNSRTDETIQVDDDQPQNQCFICNNIATSDEGDTCVICDKWCHTICMDSNVDDPTCQACNALIIQNQQLILDKTTVNEMSQPMVARQYKRIEREAIQA